MRELTISKTEENQRLDKFLLRYLNDCPSSFVYKCFRTNKIKYNGKKPKGNEKIKEGDTVKIFLLEEKLSELITVSSFKRDEKIRVEFEVVYEDENILIINKPLGLLTQRAVKEDVSLTEQVLSYLDNSLSEHWQNK